MSKTKGFLLAVAVAATAFTFSCSGDDGGGDGDGLSSSNGGGQSSSSLSSAGGSSSSVGEESSSSAGGESSSGTGVALWSSCPVTEVSENSVTCGGETYPTVKIGVQTWFAKNLNYAGDDDDKKIGRCYRNLESSCATSGRLYNWPQANAVCPDGWHLPSRNEWAVMTDCIGGDAVEGEKLKAARLWNDFNGASGIGTDDCGFSALPGGYRTGSAFISLGDVGNWWSASENESNSNNVYTRYMHSSLDYARWDNHLSKNNLLSVRCLKD